MDNALKIINDVAVYILIALLGFCTWFFKTVFGEHRKMYNFFNKNQDMDMVKLYGEIESLRHEIGKVEFESKKYWLDHKNQMEANQKILLEKLQSHNKSSDQGFQMVKQMFNSLESRLDRLENRVEKIK